MNVSQPTLKKMAVEGQGNGQSVCNYIVLCFTLAEGNKGNGMEPNDMQ